MLAFSPSPYSYGQISAGQTASQTFRLANSGKKATGRLRVRLPGSAAFTITSDSCRATRLRPGQSCAVTVRFAPASSGTVTATLIAASKRHAVTATDALSGTGMALGAPAPGHIYWANEGNGTAGTGTINEANLDGTSPHSLITGQNDPAGVAVDANHLYWASQDDGTINEANLDGTSPHTIVTGQAAPFWVAVGS